MKGRHSILKIDDAIPIHFIVSVLSRMYKMCINNTIWVIQEKRNIVMSNLLVVWFIVFTKKSAFNCCLLK
ncbi:hypothetical protein [Mycoplasma crocodyli]|uniref:Uncharacterized protein n=1 Tax=Mycoplasma crocodyli (strain ATCC 51981 / MP145) TaxID=512564 RepID=D5E6D3_MYCCM|nr:hypothetical protein [Mycoplasma crocodyli]ADE19848.1 hypothetical protein MCRO_0727 [Mycoplasma crocodyli MP145]